jgi:serine phosphatase RsbU (regulator of sigma subunit)
MRVRTQLSLAFLLLTIVPLAGIVLYSYGASERAFRRAVEREVTDLLEEIGDRMSGLKKALDHRIESISQLPLSVFSAEGHSDGTEIARVYSAIMMHLGEDADLVELLELTPERVDGGSRVARPGEAIFIHPSQTLAVALERLSRRQGSALEASGIATDFLATTVAQAVTRRSEMRAADLEALEASDAQTVHLLGAELSKPVSEGGSIVGRLRARVEVSGVLQRALTPEHTHSSDIPYVFDSDGNLFASNPELEVLLGEVSLEASPTPDFAPTGRALEDWILAEATDPESGLTFGVARPIRDSLRDLRNTALRNSAFGLGMIALAMFGIGVLSHRMTRNLASLEEGADEMAAGNLRARISVSSKDEFGQLAATMNRMAQELGRNQQRLVEEERLRREEELQTRLLAAENERKTRELEEARELQLSLLPKTLPQHPEIDIAVFMKTATEVGGDYYDFFQNDDGALTVVIGDAAGHGVRAGTMVTVVKGLLTARAGHLELPSMLHEATRAIKQMNLGRMHMAVSLVRVREGRILASSAGIPPPLVYRAATGAIEEVGLTGMPLGSLQDAAYRQWDSELQPGDTVLLMTDGFPELLDRERNQVGYPRVRQLFASSATRDPEAIVTELSAAVEKWTAGEPPEDDITFVVLKAKTS